MTYICRQEKIESLIYYLQGQLQFNLSIFWCL